MRELDVLLSEWLDTHWADADTAQRQAFAELLDAQDPELWTWCTGRERAPRDDWQALIDAFHARAVR